LSCNKDFDNAYWIKVQNPPTLKELQGLYDNLNLEDRINFEIDDSTFIRYKPEWSDLKVQFINDSTIYSILPLLPVGIRGRETIVVNLSNYREFILFENNEVAYYGKYIYQETDGIIHDPAFLSNGTLSLDNLLNGNTSFYSYINGKGSKLPVAGQRSANKMSSSALSSECAEYLTVMTCDWTTYCHETGQVFFRLSPVGTCLPPSEIRCGNTWSYWTQRAPVMQTICVKYEDPAPPIGGGGDGGSGENGGGGDTQGGIDISSLTEEEKMLYEETENEIRESCALNHMLQKLSTHGLKLIVDRQSGNPVYVFNTKTIIVNEYMVTRSDFVAHEMIHAFQHQNIGSTFHHHAQGLPGNINIEFERMLIQDVATNGLEWAQSVGVYFTRSDRDGFNFAVDAYIDLVEDIIATKDISLIPNFDIRYRDALQSFNRYGHPSYADSQILTTLQPVSLKMIFDGSYNCPE